MNQFMRKSLFLVALLLLVSAPAFAGSVHKWVDAQGVTHYSDQLPEDFENTNKPIAVTQVDVSNDYQSSVDEDDYYSVTNQWARMREERIARKQLQIEKAKQKAVQSPAVPQVVYVNEEQATRNAYYPAYSSFGHRGFRQNRFIGNRYSDRRYGTRYGSANCRVPRLNSRFSSSFGARSGHRYGGSGLTLTIR